MLVPDGSNSPLLLVTNDFGPRAGGIETFIIGLLERLKTSAGRPRTVFVYTSSQSGSESFDRRWRDQYGVQVIRDKSSILLPTPRVTKAVKSVIHQENIKQVWFGAAAPLAIRSEEHTSELQSH